MNTILFDFYRGKGVDSKGRSLDDMLALSNSDLEATHDCIQWLFPLNEASAYNKKAPLLDEETIIAIQDSIDCNIRLHLSGIRFLNFLKDDGAVHPQWITPRNHNYLRITRVIKCYRLLGQSEWAELYYKFANKWAGKFPKEINQSTLDFWHAAMIA